MPKSHWQRIHFSESKNNTLHKKLCAVLRNDPWPREMHINIWSCPLLGLATFQTLIWGQTVTEAGSYSYFLILNVAILSSESSDLPANGNMGWDGINRIIFVAWTTYYDMPLPR